MKRMSSDWYRKIWSLDIQDQSWVEDTGRQVDFLIGALGLTGGERILDLACGFGRHSLELARRGWEVTGVDITPEYVSYAAACAEKENLPAAFLCEDIRKIAFKAEFDVVLSMADGAIGYLEDDRENEKIFRVISRALKPGGKHFMDVMNGDYARSHFPCRLWDAGEKGLTLSVFEWDSATSTLIYGQQDYSFGKVLTKPEFSEGNPIRLYGKRELQELLARQGMEVVRCYSDFSGAPASGNAIQLMVYSRKELPGTVGGEAGAV